MFRGAEVRRRPRVRKGVLVEGGVSACSSRLMSLLSPAHFSDIACCTCLQSLCAHCHDPSNAPGLSRRQDAMTEGTLCRCHPRMVVAVWLALETTWVSRKWVGQLQHDSFCDVVLNKKETVVKQVIAAPVPHVMRGSLDNLLESIRNNLSR